MRDIKTTTIILTAIVFIASHSALASFEPIALAYEVKTQNFTAPATANGGLLLRECDACKYRSIRVTASTAYSVNGEPLTLDKFKDALSYSSRSNVTLTVLHHLESNTVLRVSATFVGKRAQ